MAAEEHFETVLSEIASDLTQLAEKSKVGQYSVGEHLDVTAKAKRFLREVNNSTMLGDEQKTVYKKRLVNEFELCSLDLD